MLILNVRSLKEVPALINQLSVNLTTDLKGTRGKKPLVMVGQSRDVSGLIFGDQVIHSRILFRDSDILPKKYS